MLDRFTHLRGNEPQEQADVNGTDAPSSDEMDNKVYDYILSNNGAISVNKAAEELAMSPDSIKESIQRLGLAGKLKLPDQAQLV
jgi:hypothetical protein